MLDQNQKSLDINIVDLRKRLEDLETLAMPIQNTEDSCGPHLGSFICQPCQICTLCHHA